ncbi:DUF6002 family protein [Plantactinospora sp. KBS50]|uniref:DUF6002 family protein n=1 Tax=Plantactinospora sp. KBS50 TaxID=2024580 RepID=UPI000BAAA2E9|nr:DUF6002 family protein [Plantactinospora sp. KBS50]ASW55656.1 hypothetical protein CIK06_17910 [Plantactinospora sp. KBS50]
MTTTVPRETTLDAALTHYHPRIQDALHRIRAQTPPAPGFNPGYELPAPDERLNEFFAPSALRVAELGGYGSARLRLLDLMANPATRTTKTIASLVMVARAAQYIRRTGESILIVTPTSANKGTALRDAVFRAIDCGLVPADRLQIVTVAPRSSRHKLWCSGLDRDPTLARRNPIALYGGDDAAGVKRIAAQFVAGHPGGPAARRPHVWYSLDINNYRVADAVRAFFELDFLPPEPGVRRTHAHSVSSAYGLLGHHFGRQLLGAPQPAPAYFLVQHLGTPDMVLHLRHGRVDPADRPGYEQDAGTGLFRQRHDPRFPAVTYDPAEELDPTFYTHNPPTSPQMDAVIAAQGGDGIVVSLHECMQRYPWIRHRLADAGVALPADPRRLREWSLVMALTGVCNGLDRGLVQADEVVVHGSGCYGLDDFDPPPAGQIRPVRDVDGLAAVIDRAVGAPA